MLTFQREPRLRALEHTLWQDTGAFDGMHSMMSASLWQCTGRSAPRHVSTAVTQSASGPACCSFHHA